MFCTKCGNKVEPGIKFCSHCGEMMENKTEEVPPVAEDKTYTNIEKEKQQQLPDMRGKLPKAVITVLGAGVIIGVAGILAFSVYTKPESRMNRAIQDEKIEEAYDIYIEELEGKKLSDKTAQLLCGQIAEIRTAYFAGELDYKEADEELDTYSLFGFQSDVSDSLETVQGEIFTAHQEQKFLKSAESYMADEEYLFAIIHYHEALGFNKKSEAAKTGLARAEEAYRESVVKRVDEYTNKGDFNGARKQLNEALSNMPDNEELKDLLASMDTAEKAYQEELLAKEVQDIVDEAYSSAEQGNWDYAVELLESSQEQYQDDTALLKASADIKEKMPITLKNLTMVSEEYVEVKKEVLKDRWEHIYDGGVFYDASNNATGLYNLNKRFSEFPATLFVATEATVGKNMSISIYLDEELVYFKDGITEETAPINISLDVTERQTMRIVTANEGSWPWGWLYLADTSFKKVNE